MKIKMYTDASLDWCIDAPDPNAGGCAAILVDSQSNEEITSVVEGYRLTNIHRMQIKAIIIGLRCAENLQNVEEIKIFPDNEDVTNTITLGGYRFKDTDLWEELDAVVSELKGKGIRIEFLWLEDKDDDDFEDFEIVDKVFNKAYDIAKDKDKYGIDSHFETRWMSLTDKEKKEKKENVRQRIEDVLSILMKRQLNADDQVVRYALSGYMADTFGEICGPADIPVRLSKRIMDADADTKQSFYNIIEHLCYGEGGAIEDTGIRVCSTCGELMVEGYYLDGDYACCRPCAVKNYMDAARRCGDEEDILAAEKLLMGDLKYSELNDGDVYYTEWELVEK